MISTIAPESLVVEPAVEGVVVPFVGGLALRLRQRLLGLQRVVDDDDVGAAQSAMQREACESSTWRMPRPCAVSQRRRR